MHLVYRKTCRVCGSEALTPVIDLGEQYLQGSFVKPGKEEPPKRKIACRLLRCDPTRDENACGLLQMEHSVPPEILYSAYWYRSGTNATMRNHLKGIVEEITEVVGTESASVLDIGCNDGTLLGFYPETFERWGVDPSDVAAEVGGGVKTVIDLFPSEKLNQGFGKDRKFDAVTSIAMFYDLEDPVGFVKAINNVLSANGLWIFEMSYMPTMLKKTSYDTICHEHIEYYSVAVIERILKMGGMKLVNATLNDSNGGSIRCFATPVENVSIHNNEWIENLKKLRASEFDLKLDTDEPYRDFQERVEKQRDELVQLLNRLRSEGKTIHLYGASTKGNTILQWCGIDNEMIEYAAERNPDKFGAMTLGSEIPIISEAESRAMKPDYYLVLPWHFRDEFIEREKEILQEGAKFIFPLPEVEVVGAEIFE
ncbi:MAG: class I SAM-dependent methyltransferase [Verrucomicrobiota bacterium]